MKKIGELLKEARQESGLTADEIAEYLGFATRTSVYQIEKRERIDFSLLKRISKLYNKPISFFVDYLDTLEDTDDHDSSTPNSQVQEPTPEYLKRDNPCVNEIYAKDQKIIALQETIINLQREVIELTKQVKS